MNVNLQLAEGSTSKPESALDDAKAWIGRQLVLRKPWLGFNAGTSCVVMCVVDFGDGLLLWITTDEEYPQEVDQVEISFVRQFCSPWHVVKSSQAVRSTMKVK